MTKPDNKKPTDAEHATRVGDAPTIIPDNHVDEGWRSKFFVPMDDIYQHMIQKGQLAAVLYQQTEKYYSPQTATEMQDMIDSSKKLAKLINQYYADFYRNKILEELKKELREHHDKYPDMDFGETMGYIVGFQKRPSITAQFNSKGDSDE